MTPSYPSTALRRAIERGISNGQLEQELNELGDFAISSRADAEAVCWGLRRLDRTTPNLATVTHALGFLFQHIANGECEAAVVLQRLGIPELLRLYDEIQMASAPKSVNTLLFILKLAAIYGTTQGALKVIEAARQPLEPEAYIWSTILGAFQAGHPQTDLVFGALKDPLPPGFIRVSLLDAANTVLLSGETLPHPFDTPEGRAQLKNWLQTTDPDEESYAQSAAAALPFINHPEQEPLLNLALNHAKTQVRLEAAWAAARIGREDGVRCLVEHCRDLRTAHVAKRYLRELECEDFIPDEATHPCFTAMAEFAHWCAHPNELGQAPDELEIIDHRPLRWPPEWETKPFWLIRYKLKDASGLEEDEEDCGLVGSVTFSLFCYKLSQRPVEDAYAVHCYWEMEQRGLITESDLAESPDEDYSNLLEQWQGPPLADVKMKVVAELSPELEYPQRLVALASATLKGESGWVVLDGQSSTWYPGAEQPDPSPPHAALKVHVGRRLLGFTGKPDRKKYLKPAAPEQSMDQRIIAYEKLLAEAEQADPAKQKELFRALGPLSLHFDEYMDALAMVGRESDARRVIEIFAAHWKRPGEFYSLGAAALGTGHLDLAEKFLVKFKDATPDYEHCPEMVSLASVWWSNGKPEAAKSLLLQCLSSVLAETKTAKNREQSYLESIFREQRSVFLQLFPELGEKFLTAEGIPTSTILDQQQK